MIIRNMLLEKMLARNYKENHEQTKTYDKINKPAKIFNLIR